MKALRNQNMARCMTQICKEYGPCEAVRWKDRSWTYEELQKITDQLAAGMLAMGVQKGSHVAFWADAEPNAIFAFYALQKTGAVTVMLNTSLKERELDKQFLASDVEFLVAGRNGKGSCFAQEYPQIAARFPADKCFCISGEGEKGWITFTEILAAGGPEDNRKLQEMMWSVQPSDLALMLFTSGTTGEFKVVCLTSFHMVNGGLLKAMSMEMTENDRVCCSIPMFHIFCIDVNILAALMAGACLVLPEDRHTSTILRCIQEEKCTILCGVPSTFLALIGRADFSSYDVSSLRTGIIGGAPCTPQQFREIDRKLDFTLLPGLGQSEVVAGITVGRMSDPLEARSNSVGPFAPYIEGKIVPIAEGAEQDGHPVGEVCVRGPMMMAGYYKRPDLTARTIGEDGWLRTGDLGWLDEKHNLHLAGRLKDVIIRGGENIMPSELEEVVEEDRQVAECKAIGVPDSHYGEEVCMCVVPAEGAALGEKQILGMLSSKVAAYKMPKYVLFFHSFPYNDTGKIAGGELREMARKALAL